MNGYIFYKHMRALLTEERDNARANKQWGMIASLNKAIEAVSELERMH
jgi:hypothetical protein